MSMFHIKNSDNLRCFYLLWISASSQPSLFSKIKIKMLVALCCPNGIFLIVFRGHYLLNWADAMYSTYLSCALTLFYLTV